MLTFYLKHLKTPVYAPIFHPIYEIESNINLKHFTKTTFIRWNVLGATDNQDFVSLTQISKCHLKLRTWLHMNVVNMELIPTFSGISIWQSRCSQGCPINSNVINWLADYGLSLKHCWTLMIRARLIFFIYFYLMFCSQGSAI